MSNLLTRLRRTAFAAALALLAVPAFGQGGLGGGISNPRPLTAQTVVGALGYSPARSGINYDITALPGLTDPLPAAALPAPTASTLGGVKSIVAVPSRFLTSITTGGQPVAAQPAASDITGLAPSATIDATDAGNIGTGSLSLLRLAPIADQRLLANLSGGPAAPAATTLSSLLDNMLGSAQGSVLYRGASSWGLLAPGAAGQYLQTQGAAADVQWASPAGSGTVSPGTAGQIAHYAGTGDAVGGASALPNGITATTQAAHDNSAKVATAAYSERAAALPGFLHGLRLSTAGSSATFGIAAGSATDSSAVARMRLASAYTKTTAAWGVGSGNGSLDFGTVGNALWYHAYLIQKADLTTVDVLTSLANGNVDTATITIATPAVVTWADHGLQVGSPVSFATTGALPPGLTAGTSYYVIATGLTTGAFQLSATQGGAAINTTGSQSGVHTASSLPALPATYSLYRRIGSMETNGSAQWVKFAQKGDYFFRASSVDFVAGSTSGMTLRSLAVPTGVSVLPLLSVYVYAANSTATSFSLAPASDSSLSTSVGSLFESAALASDQLSTTTGPPSNRGRQIYVAVPSFSLSGSLTTYGWIDRRGQDE